MSTPSPGSECPGAAGHLGTVELRHPPIDHEHGHRDTGDRAQRIVAAGEGFDDVSSLPEAVGTYLAHSLVVVDDDDQRRPATCLVNVGVGCHDLRATIALGLLPGSHDEEL